MSDYNPTLDSIQESYKEFVDNDMAPSWDYNAEVAHETARDAALHIPVLMRLAQLVGPVVESGTWTPTVGHDDCPFEALRGAWKKLQREEGA